MIGKAFLAYVRRLLAPTLTKGHVVVDNLAAHKVAGVRKAIKATGAGLLTLPPCSADLNPIEQACAKLKALLRKTAAEKLFGPPAATCSALSAQINAETTSSTQPMRPSNAEML